MNLIIEVESGIAPPKRGAYPFAKMSVGESVKIKGSTKEIGRARRAAWQHAFRAKKKFTTALYDDRDGGFYVRIWRTE